MSQSADPLTAIYDSLWAAAEAHAPFAALVRPENRIKLTGDAANPFKPSQQAADSPQVMLLPRGGRAPSRWTSGKTYLVQRYAFLVATDQKRVDRVGAEAAGAALFPVKWELFRALSGLVGQTLTYTWGDATYSATFRADEQSDRMGDPEGGALPGWATVWEIAVELGFRSADVAPSPTP